MKTNLTREFTLLVLALIPLGYLVYIWPTLADTVPLHWNIKGEVDRVGPKTSLIYIPILVCLLPYILFLIIPYIDPKGKIQQMGNKYQQIRMALAIFMTILTMYIIYSSQTSNITNINFVFMAIGGLFMVLGNYFKTIKANYFVGIRTPWTLESEAVWKSTHLLAGKMWFLGGLAIILSSLMISKEINTILFMCITAILIIVPIVYSYKEFKKING